MTPEDIKKFSVIVNTDTLIDTFQEIEKRILDSLPELDLIQLNGMIPRFIKIDVEWRNGNKWNPYLDTIKENK